MKNIESLQEFKELILNDKKLIDVRAPIEFEQGHIPGAINLPILNNEERAFIGTTYKKSGREQAMKAGFELVSGANKLAKVTSWKDEILKAPEQTVLYCFRGGQRSQITQKWMQDEGIEVPLIVGGYKAVRNFLIEFLVAQIQVLSFIPISGRTGSNKTKLIHELRNKKIKSCLDLEGLANHKGSAFGGMGWQPSQAQFENKLTVDLFFQTADDIVYVEDESRLIGKCVIPDPLFLKMRQAPILWVDEDISIRSQNILSDYVLTPLAQAKDVSEVVIDKLFDQFLFSLNQIKNKLGGLRFSEVQQDILSAKTLLKQQKDASGNLVWIEKLLKYYYDPMYERSLEKRNPTILKRGSYKEILAFLYQ